MSLASSYKEKFQKERGAVGTQLLGERAQIIIDEMKGLSLFSQAQCLNHLGRSFTFLIHLILTGNLVLPLYVTALQFLVTIMLLPCVGDTFRPLIRALESESSSVVSQ